TSLSKPRANTARHRSSTRDRFHTLPPSGTFSTPIKIQGQGSSTSSKNHRLSLRCNQRNPAHWHGLSISRLYYSRINESTFRSLDSCCGSSLSETYLSKIIPRGCTIT